MLKTLQAGRGVAAVAVLLYHLNHQIFNDLGMNIPWLTVGWAGVDFFFVLSGFIIYYVHAVDVGSGRVLEYARKRVVRLYPVYWVVLAGVLGLLFTFPAFGEAAQRAPATIVSSLLLFPSGAPTVVGQAWTLYHEALFYCLFGLCVLDRRFVGLALAWFAACAVRIVSPTPLWNEINNPVFFLTSPLNLLFGLGVVTGWALRNRRALRPGMVTAAGVAILATSLPFLPLQAAWVHLLFAAGCALLVYGLCALEMAGKVRVSRPLQLVGDASYSIYLTHTFLIAIGAKALHMVTLPAPVAFVALGLSALAGGVGFHLVVERPLLKALRERTGIKASLSVPR